MSTRDVDVAIIGAGTAGLTARRAAQSNGASALMIDPGPFGTTCARVGCMPSKLLIAAAEAAHHAQHADVFGVHADVRIDGPAVLERVRRERDRFVGFVTRATDAHQAEGRLEVGRATFVDAHTIQVDNGTTVRAKSVIIATGSTPWVPPPYRKLGPPGPDGPVLRNDDVFELKELPESVLVVGAGVIGLELGQALHRLGVRVTLLGLGGGVGPLTDPKLIAEAKTIFQAELDLHTHHEDLDVQQVDGGVQVAWTAEDGLRRQDVYQYVLMGAGRQANVGGMGLENTGVPLDERGMPQHDEYTLRIGHSNLFIAGDACGHRPLLHEAAEEGRIAGANAASLARDGAVLAHRRTAMLAITFTDPQIAVVGQPWRSMHCDNQRTGEVDYGDQGRSRVMNLHKGRVRIAGEVGTGRLLAAEMVGPRVEHTSHLLAWAIQQGLTVSDALSMPFYHPVIEEGIRTALRDLQANLHISRAPGAPCEEFGPGD